MESAALGSNAGVVDRIWGGLAGAVIGDAMGTATETMTRRQIVATFGRLTEIVAPENSPFSGGRPAGHYSDDSSQMLLMAERFAEVGAIRTEDVVEKLLQWADNEDMFGRTAGPTTREAVRRLRAGEDPTVVGRGHVSTGTGLSNGAAMKTAPAGWMNPGNIEAAVQAAARMAIPTHCTQIAISGAGAVAGAIAMATAGRSNFADIVEAAIEGAEIGERIGLEIGREAAGPSVVKRIRLAVKIGASHDDIWGCLDEVSDIIGSGLPTVESVPAAFAMIAAGRADVKQSIIGAVNVSNDTDTVATIVGAITGTMAGVAGVPTDWRELVETVNQLDLKGLAGRLAAAGA